MVTFADVRSALQASAASSASIRECVEVLQSVSGSEHFEEFGQGRMTAGEASANFAIREETARRAGIDTCGIPETLAALARTPAREDVLLFHFSGARRLFTVFVSLDGDVLGCVRVVRRPTEEVM